MVSHQLLSLMVEASLASQTRQVNAEGKQTHKHSLLANCEIATLYPYFLVQVWKFKVWAQFSYRIEFKIGRFMLMMLRLFIQKTKC